MPKSNSKSSKKSGQRNKRHESSLPYPLPTSTTTFENPDTHVSHGKAVEKFNRLYKPISELKREYLEIIDEINKLYGEVRRYEPDGAYHGDYTKMFKAKKTIEERRKYLAILEHQLKELIGDYEINSHYKDIVKNEDAAVENMKKLPYDSLKTIFDFVGPNGFVGPRGGKSRKQNKKRKTKRRKTNKKY